MTDPLFFIFLFLQQRRRFVFLPLAVSSRPEIRALNISNPPPPLPSLKTPYSKKHNFKSSLVEPKPPSKAPSLAASSFCTSAKHLPLILLADPGAPARRAVWIGLDLGAAEVIEKPPAESKLRTFWQHAVRRACPPPPSPALLLPPSSSAAAAMRRRSISGALGGGGGAAAGGGGCSSTSLGLSNGNGLMPSADASRDSLDSVGGLAANLTATATSSKSAAAAAAAAQARAAAATAARSAAVCRRANSMGSRPAPRKFVARSASAARTGGSGNSGSRGSLDASALHRAVASGQHLEQLLSNSALARSLASMSAPQPLPPPPMVLIPLGPGEEACDADDAATSAVAAAMTAGLDITRSLTPPSQIIGANQGGGRGGDATTPPGCVWGTPLLASTAADAAAAAASTAAATAGAPAPAHAAAAAAASQPAAAAVPSYRHYPVDNAHGDDGCCLAPPPITSFEESSVLTSGSGGNGSGGLSPAESGGNGGATGGCDGGGGGGGSGHQLRSPSSAFEVRCPGGGGDDARSRGGGHDHHHHHHGHVPLIDLADALDDFSLTLGLPALVPPAGKDDRD